MTWKAEIQGLHDFFTDWFSGTADAMAIATLESALEPEFTLVSPDGIEHSGQDTIAAVVSAKGQRVTSIETRNHRLLAESDSYVVARYEEWHDGAKGRVSTVVFRKRDQGLGWLTVQETWL